MVEKLLGEVKGIFNTITLIEFGTSIVAVLLGLILFTNETMSHVIVSVLACLIILVMGMTSIFSYFRRENIDLYNLNLIYGIVEIILAILAVVLYKYLPIILGISLFVVGVQKITYALILKKYNESSWLITLATGLFIIIIGIIGAFAKGDGVIPAIGIVILGLGLINAADVLLLRKRSNAFLD